MVTFLVTLNGWNSKMQPKFSSFAFITSLFPSTKCVWQHQDGRGFNAWWFGETTNILFRVPHPTPAMPWPESWLSPTTSDHLHVPAWHDPYARYWLVLQNQEHIPFLKPWASSHSVPVPVPQKKGPFPFLFLLLFLGGTELISFIKKGRGTDPGWLMDPGSQQTRPPSLWMRRLQGTPPVYELKTT